MSNAERTMSNAERTMSNAERTMSTARSRRARRAKQAGYTLIEIMTALALLMVGATGIFAIQTGATVANMEARRMASANQVGQMVIERIRRDALLWRSGGSLMDATAFAGTTYLTNAPLVGDPPTAWMNPPAGLNAFDYYGNGTTVVERMAYCAQMRFAWVYYGQALRTDVRVYFPRRGDGSDSDSSDATTATGCPELTAASSALLADLHFVHLSTIVRWTPVAP